MYRFKRPWRDGATHIVMQPWEMLEKLAALVPYPRAHLVRYSGLLAPAAKWRPWIVPEYPSTAESVSLGHFNCPADTFGSDIEPSIRKSVSPESVPTPSQAPAASVNRGGRNYTWAELMKRVWALDVLECPRCHERLRILAAIHPPDATRKILECLGLSSRAPPVAPAVGEFATRIDPS